MIPPVLIRFLIRLYCNLLVPYPNKLINHQLSIHQLTNPIHDKLKCNVFLQSGILGLTIRVCIILVAKGVPTYPQNKDRNIPVNFVLGYWLILQM